MEEATIKSDGENLMLAVQNKAWLGPRQPLIELSDLNQLATVQGIDHSDAPSPGLQALEPD
jgi:hypothetical protein